MQFQACTLPPFQHHHHRSGSSPCNACLTSSCLHYIVLHWFFSEVTFSVSGEYRTCEESHDSGDRHVESFECAGPGGLLAGAEKLAFTIILAGVAVLGFQVGLHRSGALAATVAALNNTYHQRDTLHGCQL